MNSFSVTASTVFNPLRSAIMRSCISESFVSFYEYNDSFMIKVTTIKKVPSHVCQ